MRTHGPGRLLDFLVGGLQLAIANVLPNGVGKQESLLQYDPKLLTQRLDGDLSEVMTVNKDRSPINVV